MRGPSMSDFANTPPELTHLPIVGTDRRFVVRRLYCIGRNYAAHAIEMGHVPDREPPFFFQKNPDDLNATGKFAYPTQSSDVHHEIELAVALGSGGTDIAEADALSHVFGYAVSLDMTRRDLQSVAKKAGRPWEVGKAFAGSAPIAPLHPVDQVGHLAKGLVRLTVDGEARQIGNLDQMIWTVPEIISYLSRYFTLGSGDVILTGTPSGVGPVMRGQHLTGAVAGLHALEVDII